MEGYQDLLGLGLPQAQTEETLAPKVKVGLSEDLLGLGLPQAQTQETLAPEVKAALNDATLEERVDSVVLEGAGNRWCSWCFEECSQELIRSSIVGRSTYQCGACGNQTASCLRQCGRMVRSFADKPDKTCYKCSGISKEACVSEGNCSWCMQSNVTFILFRARQLCRAEFICTVCKNMVNPCRRCSESFSRKQDSYAEERCLKCDGTVSDWSTAQEEITEKWNAEHRWCSWCLQVHNHSIQQWRVGVKNVFKCLGCLRQTVACVSCEIGMTRRNRLWKDTRCLACSTGIEWEALQLRREIYFSKRINVRTLLSEMSSQRKQARKEGLERPFLFLISMRPEARTLIAYQLDLEPLIGQGIFGDPHAESWFILSAKNGIRDRTYPTSTRLNFRASHHSWYDIVRLVCQSAFEEKSGPFQAMSSWTETMDVNQDFTNDIMYRLEFYFFRQLIKMQKRMERWQMKQMRYWSQIDDDEESESSVYSSTEEIDSDNNSQVLTIEQSQMIREKLAKYGGVHEQEMAKYAVSAAANALGINSMSVAYVGTVGAHAVAAKMALVGVAHGFGSMSVAFGAVMGPWGMAGVFVLAGMGVNYMLGSSEGALLEPLITILNQRFVLALESIDIRTYHTFIQVEGIGLCHPLPIDPLEEKRAAAQAAEAVEQEEKEGKEEREEEEANSSPSPPPESKNLINF